MKSKIFLFSFLALLVFSTAALADDNITTEYELVVPSSNTNMDYTQGAYNLIGDLKVKVSGEGSFKPTATVEVTVNFDGVFKSGSNEVSYNLVSGTGDSQTNLRNGDKFIFTAASIDAGTSITLGAKITGDASGAADGAYMSDISFSSTLINPLLAGDIYTFGSFLSGDVNLVSLDWRVLSVDEANNRALLVTEQAVTKMAYQTAGNSYNWSTSDVKTWLNGTGDNQFLKGFSTEEKARILKVSITDGTEGQNKNSSTIIAPNQSADGLDSVFLLSVADVGGYFSNNGYNDDDRKCTLLTDSSVCKWWLRSPGKDDNTRVAQIDDDGVVDDDGSFVTNIIGVRPAVWIKLK